MFQDLNYDPDSGINVFEGMSCMRQFIMSYSSARKQHVGAQEAFLKKYSISTMKEKEHEILIPFEFLATDEMANEYDMNPTLDSTGTAKKCLTIVA